jgi:HD-GYP domain-containing protein (c-di-GMP phosphodiesterase class II)
MAGIPNDVILVAYQHHENWVGFGYPQKLSKSKTHPLARLIHVVDLFCDYAIGSPGNPSMSGKEALAQMTTYFESSLDPAAFTALKSLFGSRPA